MFSLVVFDLDGTLVDSKADLARAVNHMLGGLGAAPLPEAVVADMVGEGAAVLVSRAIAAAGVDAAGVDPLERFLAAYESCLLDSTRPYDGIVELLDALSRKMPLAVLTNKPAAATNRLMDGLNLRRFFESILGGDSPHGRKPAAAGLEQIVTATAATMASTLLVGDSAIDLQTARRAGARICLARYGFGFRFSADAFRGDELFIDRPLDLLPLVR